MDLEDIKGTKAPRLECKYADCEPQAGLGMPAELQGWAWQAFSAKHAFQEIK